MSSFVTFVYSMNCLKAVFHFISCCCSSRAIQFAFPLRYRSCDPALKTKIKMLLLEISYKEDKML